MKEFEKWWEIERKVVWGGAEYLSRKTWKAALEWALKQAHPDENFSPIIDADELEKELENK